MQSLSAETDGRRRSAPAVVHPAWIVLIKLCQEIGFGEIERIKIQDGIPVLVEKSVQKIKLI